MSGSDAISIVDQHRILESEGEGAIILSAFVGGAIGSVIGALVGVVKYIVVAGAAKAGFMALVWGAITAGASIGATVGVVLLAIFAIGYAIIGGINLIFGSQSRNLRMLAASSHLNKEFYADNIVEKYAPKIWYFQTGEKIGNEHFKNSAAIMCTHKNELSLFYLQPNPTSESDFMLFSIADVVNGYDYTGKFVTYKCSRNDSPDDKIFKECNGMFKLITRAIVPIYEEMIKSDGEEKACSYAKNTLSGMLKAMEDRNKDHLIRGNPNFQPNHGMLDIQNKNEYEENAEEIKHIFQRLNSSIENKNKNYRN